MKVFFSVFLAFAKVGALTFGGGYTMLPLLHREIAEKQGWATVEEITDYYAVAQCLPGIIAANVAMLIGHKKKGVLGMVAAVLGVAFPALLASTIIAIFIERISDLEMARHALSGMAVAVIALIIGAVAKMWQTGVKDIFGICIFAVTFAVFTFVNISPIIPVIAGALCGIIIKEAPLRKRGAKL